MYLSPLPVKTKHARVGSFTDVYKRQILRNVSWKFMFLMCSRSFFAEARAFSAFSWYFLSFVFLSVFSAESIA